MKRSTIIEIISSLLILLFMYAAVSKLLDYKNFKLQLGKSPFIAEYAAFVSWFLPVTEIIISLLLTLKRTRLAGLFLSLFLMTVFTGYIWGMLNYSYYTPCSCGGILSTLTWEQHLWFNIAFIVISFAGIIIYAKDKLSEQNDLQQEHLYRLTNTEVFNP